MTLCEQIDMMLMYGKMPKTLVIENIHDYKIQTKEWANMICVPEKQALDYLEIKIKEWYDLKLNEIDKIYKN